MKNCFSRNDSRVILLLMFLFISSPILALNTSETRTINVATAGKLSTLLPQNERGYVENLTLTGKLNGTDFNILRAMATDQKLQVLDLSGANIVSGGESYYSNYGTDYYTKNNEFGYSLFNGCNKIQKLVLPNSLVTIGQCAFWYCTSLKTLIIGSKVTTIKSGLWGGCRQLTDVQIKNNSNFHLINGILYNKDYTTIIATLQTWNYGDLTIRSGVKEIQYNAFAFCSKLTSISFPSSVTTIGDTAFEYTGITSVKFTSSITSIGSFAFSGCESLKQLDLTPLKVTSLDYGVFMTSKIEIVYLPKTLKELKQAVFSRTPLKHIFAYTATPATMYDLKTSSPSFENVDTKSCIVHVPQGKVNTYKSAAGWKDFLYITDGQEIEASTNEAYAVYTTDGTLTFYYDKQKSSRTGTKYSLNTGANAPGWYTDHYKDIKKAVFHSSFAGARPTSTYNWFATYNNGESVLSDIVDIQYLNTSSATNMGRMFCYCNRLTSLDLSHFDTSNVINMKEMFWFCTNLTSLDLSNFNTNKVTNMAYMFGGCSRLTMLDLSNFNTSGVTKMAGMYEGCNKIKSLDLSKFDTSNVTDMSYMFEECSSLTNIDLSNFNTSRVTNMSQMFDHCRNLTTIYAGEDWNTNNVKQSGEMFDWCTNLVGGAGTKYDYNNVDKAYAHIDGGTSNPGYLTDKNAPAAKEAYAVYTNDGILTFYYDTKRSSRSGTTYNMNTGSNAPGWFNDHRKDIKKVVFNSSFSEARPISTYHWFGVNSGMEVSILSEIVGIRYLNTSEVTNMKWMFGFCVNLKSLDLGDFDTSKVTDMSYMFYCCTSLTSLGISNFNTSNVKTMYGMFESCSSLTSLDVSHFDTSKVTDMQFMFNCCRSLTSLDVSHFDTSKITDMRYMFNYCGGLTSLDVSHFNTSNVTTIAHMFSYSGLTSLDVSHFDTSKVTDMESMFSGCSSLTSLDVSNFKTNKVVSMSYMFSGCSSLATIYVGEGWNTENVTSSYTMFHGCTNLIGGAGTKYDANHVDISYAHIDGGSNNPGYLTDKNATSLMNLQEFIDANAGATGVVDVDLSKFYDVVRETTLNVSTGASYRFINGTLSRAESLDNPVMLVNNGSKVEIGNNAVITATGGYCSYETIRLEGGTLNVIQGVVEGTLYTLPGYIGNPFQSNAVLLTSPSDHFYLYDGEVYGDITCSAEGADVRFDKGKLFGFGLRNAGQSSQNGARRATPIGSRAPIINTHSDIYINATTSQDFTWGYYDPTSEDSDNSRFEISLKGQSVLYLEKKYDKGFYFHLDEKEDGDVIVAGENHTITQNEVDYMDFEPINYQTETGWKQRDAYLELKNNKVYLRFKSDELPNTGCDEEWLQKKLDEIASKKPSEPVELTICEDGIKLTKNILVDKDCKVVLTGGPITSETSIDYRYGREGLFMVYGELGFHDINLNFKNDAKGDGSLGYFWSGGGKLEHNKDTVSTTNGTFVGGLGELTITDAELYIGGEEMIISSGINTIISDYVRLLGQKTYCNGKIAVNKKNNPETGLAQLPIFGVDEIRVTTSLDLWAPENYLRDVYLYKDASVITYENGFMHLQISGEWDQMALGRAFVTSESIGQDDYNNMTFTGMMPIDRKVEFVPGSHQVRLISSSPLDMQASLSGLAYVSQTAPTTLYLNSDAVNMVYQSAAINHQDVTFNGMPNGATSRSRLHFTKDQILTIGKVGRLTLANIDITGEDGNEGFEVYGKLIISENVHVSNLSCLLHIYAGGSVYASAALRSPISIQFMNGLASGNTVIAGTDGYQLTETDLDYITVEGCELQLDKIGNRIIALNGTGIEAIKDIPGTTLQDGVFDLSGRKVVPARQGMYIIKDGDKARKIYVK